MPKTTNDNRLRIPHDLWLSYVNACYEDEISPKTKVVQLIADWLTQRRLPKGEVHIAAQPILEQHPPQRKNSTFVNDLLSDDLFS